MHINDRHVYRQHANSQTNVAKNKQNKTKHALHATMTTMTR